MSNETQTAREAVPLDQSLEPDNADCEENKSKIMKLLATISADDLTSGKVPKLDETTKPLLPILVSLATIRHRAESKNCRDIGAYKTHAYNVRNFVGCKYIVEVVNFFNKRMDEALSTARATDLEGAQPREDDTQFEEDMKTSTTSSSSASSSSAASSSSLSSSSTASSSVVLETEEFESLLSSTLSSLSNGSSSSSSSGSSSSSSTSMSINTSSSASMTSSSSSASVSSSSSIASSEMKEGKEEPKPLAVDQVMKVVALMCTGLHPTIVLRICTSLLDRKPVFYTSREIVDELNKMNNVVELRRDMVNVLCDLRKITPEDVLVFVNAAKSADLGDKVPTEFTKAIGIEPDDHSLECLQQQLRLSANQAWLLLAMQFLIPVTRYIPTMEYINNDDKVVLACLTRQIAWFLPTNLSDEQRGKKIEKFCQRFKVLMNLVLCIPPLSMSPPAPASVSSSHKRKSPETPSSSVQSVSPMVLPINSMWSPTPSHEKSIKKMDFNDDDDDDDHNQKKKKHKHDPNKKKADDKEKKKKS